MKKQFVFVCLLLEAVVFLYAQHPFIGQLETRDEAFKQYLSDVEAARRLVFNKERPVSPAAAAGALTVYAYAPRVGDTLFRIAARCGIPPASLSTLNHLEHSTDSIENRAFVLLPSIPGLFVPLEPLSDLERLMCSSRTEDNGVVITLIQSGKKEKFLFIPGADFNATETAFFLTSTGAFRYPLRHFTLTSDFGIRKNPITGTVKSHDGLDLAAPSGTEVFATQSGVVTDVGNDSIYGNYIIIRHEGNWVSLYGHLSKFETSLHSVIQAGALIGRVGSTGQSTGPHLHFELRQNGKAQDPGKYLFKGSVP
jgi:murein DD-endopeptidase MepM/ murein hydrolase activator NlpD